MQRGYVIHCLTYRISLVSEETRFFVGLKIGQLFNGYLLHCMHKQQDFFGCLAEILGCLAETLGCLGLREAKGTARIT